MRAYWFSTNVFILRHIGLYLALSPGLDLICKYVRIVQDTDCYSRVNYCTLHAVAGNVHRCFVYMFFTQKLHGHHLGKACVAMTDSTLDKLIVDMLDYVNM